MEWAYLLDGGYVGSLDWIGLILIELGNEMIMQEPSILPVVDSPKYSAAQKKYHIQYSSVNKTFMIETK